MADSRSIVRRALLAAAAFALLVFGLVVQQIMTNGRLVTIDRRTSQRIARQRFFEISTGRLPLEGWWVEPSRAVTVLGDPRFLAGLAIGVGGLLLAMRRPRAGLFVIGATVGGAVLDLIVRSIIGQVRPNMPFPFFFSSQDGLPSGHALDATVCFGAIVIVLFPRMSVAARIASAVGAALLVLIVSVSRVTLLTHYISDVIAGVALGLAWLFALSAIFTPWTEDPAYDSRGSGASVSIW
jgi:membrane-associated phospholipid phosphatase